MQQPHALGRRHHHDDRQPLFDQRDRPVFELSGRESLGVHVRQLLELERTLQRHRVSDVAPQEQDAGGLRVLPREFGDRIHGGDDALDQLRHGLQLVVLTSHFVGVFGPASLCQGQAHNVIGGHLG